MASLGTLNRIGNLIAIFALAITGIIPISSWQCADGTPCPANCPMLQRTASKVEAGPSGHCSHCTESPASRSVAHRTIAGCSTPSCIYRSSNQPDSTLTRTQAQTYHTTALLPASFALSSDEVRQSLGTAGFAFFPQHFLRSTSGRAPPAFSA